jgi:type I restriction enzyme S subunit
MGLRPLPDVESRFVAYFLQTDEYRHRVSELSSGSNINNLKRDHIQSFPFRLAPLNEQRRIVAKIEELFSDLDAGVEALTRAKANLKRYRASVLKAAVEGRLTAAWRAEHPKTEPASALLARILTERRQKWEADQLAKFTAAGKSAPKNWKDKYPEPAAPDTTDLPDLPPGWCWASVDQVASQDDYSLAIGPFGSNLKVSDYAQNGVPLVFVRNIRSGKFSDEGCKFVSPEKAIELDAHSVEGGDVLITKMGDPPGDACLYPRNLPKAIITADCIKVRLHQSLPFPGYFVDAINSAVVQSQIQGITKGVAQQKVSLGRFSTVALPLPPVTEQEELVSAISDAFSQINAAETQIEHGLLRAARLRQSILKQAFEGKLVPQDPADEPASGLLARLQPTEADKRGAGSQTSPRRAKIRK